MNAVDFSWHNDFGAVIYGKLWPVQRPKAVIALVHGLGEHINRYDHVAEFFNARDIAVIGYDRLGHGRSEGKRGHVPGFEYMLWEIDKLLLEAETRYPGRPVLLYGHSMGGNLAIRYAMDRKPKVIGVVATGPLIQVNNQPSNAFVAVVKQLKKLMPAFSQSNGLNVKDISSDPEEVKKYVEDDLVHDRISWTCGYEMLTSGNFLHTYSGAFPLPLLVQHGLADNITDPKASEAFVRRTTGPVSFRGWPGLYHEIHNEPQKAEVLQFTLDWIQNLLG